jgi:hypothetical protein
MNMVVGMTKEALISCLPKNSQQAKHSHAEVFKNLGINGVAEVIFQYMNLCYWCTSTAIRLYCKT